MATNQEEAAAHEFSLERVKLDGGMAPATRGGATLTQIEGTGAVFLIGGADREGTSYGDVHRFDLDAHRWTLVQPSKGSLPPRSGHSAVGLSDKIYVFGGLDAAESEIYNDVYVFDTRASSWTKAPVEGEAPTPRNAHAAVALPKRSDSDETRRMLMYGGSSPESGAFSDLFVLHVPTKEDTAQTLRWEKLSPTGEIPEARELHCALLQSESNVCFAGGRNLDGKVCTDMALLDVSSWTWQLVPICEWNRCSIAAGVVEGELISFGGWDGGRIRGDACRYADDEESWLPVPIADARDDKQPVGPALPDIPERFGHCGTTVTMPAEGAGKTRQQGLLVFGGMNAEGDLNDLVLISRRSAST